MKHHPAGHDAKYKHDVEDIAGCVDKCLDDPDDCLGFSFAAKTDVATENCWIVHTVAKRTDDIVFSKFWSYYEYDGQYEQTKTDTMGVCTIRAEATTTLGEFATCTQYSGAYLACERYKVGEDLKCKFNYYIFGDDARYVGALGARLVAADAPTVAPAFIEPSNVGTADGPLWRVGADAIEITNLMMEEDADAAARALVIVPLSVCDGTACAWECSRLCVGMEPSKPCKAFGWH
jgi:hypothetical protein